MTESEYINYLAHMLDESSLANQEEHSGIMKFWGPVFENFNPAEPVESKRGLEELGRKVTDQFHATVSIGKKFNKIPVIGSTQAEVNSHFGTRKNYGLGYYDAAYAVKKSGDKTFLVPDAAESKIVLAFDSGLGDSAFSLASTVCHEILHQYMAEIETDELNGILGTLEFLANSGFDSNEEIWRVWHGGKFAEFTPQIEDSIGVVIMTDKNGATDKSCRKYTDAFEIIRSEYEKSQPNVEVEILESTMLSERNASIEVPAFLTQKSVDESDAVGIAKTISDNANRITDRAGLAASATSDGHVHFLVA